MWYHSFKLPNEEITGKLSFEVLDLKRKAITVDFTGKTVLDIGCWDGFYSFEAYKAGASYTLGIDMQPWSSQKWRENFVYIKSKLVPECDFNKIRHAMYDAFNIDEMDIKFDIVLLLGVLYHVKHPMLLLEKCFNRCNECLILETAIVEDSGDPFMNFYPSNELGGDYSNWWAPNITCMIEMLKVTGFQRIESDILMPNRGIFHAYK